ncbi:MAG: alpha/beta fold hydrolase [Azonexus sp.]
MLSCCDTARAGGLVSRSDPEASGAARPETRFFERAAGRIAFDDSGGHGPLIVAIPGMGEIRQQYRLVRPQLVRSGYRFVTLDIRGHGQSSVNWTDYSARAVGGDVLALIDHLRADSAVVLGNSFAAGAALWAACEQPDRVRGIGMLGPILRDLPVDPLTRIVARIGFAGPWRTWFWMTYWNSLFPLHKPVDHAAYRERLAANLKEPGRMKVLQKMASLSKSDTEALVGKIPVPVLIVMGSRDPDFKDPVAESAWLARKMDARVVLAHGAGHYPHVESPDQVAREIEKFLKCLKGR